MHPHAVMTAAPAMLTLLRPHVVLLVPAVLAVTAVTAVLLVTAMLLLAATVP
jgi:hypothetical protein